MRALVIFVFAAMLLAACSTPVELPCPTGAVFTHALIHPDSLERIDPLGNVNPTGHTFPSDHSYWYMSEDGTGDPHTVNIWSPCDATILRARATDYVNEGWADFQIDLQVCPRMTVVLAHLAALDAGLLGEHHDYTRWTLVGEHGTGANLHRIYEKSLSIEVEAGRKVAEAGILSFQRGVDFGFYDQTRSSPPVANGDRWSGHTTYLKAAHPLEAYEEGPLLDALLDLNMREDVAGDEHPLGRAMQDVPGTARGCWFREGAGYPPEDEHLALVGWSFDSRMQVFSVGRSVPTLFSGVYVFTPGESGRLDRAFEDVVPDGQVYAWHPPTDWTPGAWEGSILVQMPDAETLWIEGVEAVLTDPADWVFSDAKSEFKR